MKKAFIFCLLTSVLSMAQGFAFGGCPSPPEENFRNFERFSAWYNNIIPGLGSIFMGDKIGAITNFALGSSGITLMIASGWHYEEICASYILIDDPNTRVEKCHSQMTKNGSNLMKAGVIVWLSQFLVYNTYRSITYDKPRSVAYNKSGDFNLALLPNRNGNLNAHLMYNKAF